MNNYLLLGLSVLTLVALNQGHMRITNYVPITHLHKRWCKGLTCQTSGQLFDRLRARTIAFTIALGNRPVKLFSYLIIPRAIIGELVITSNNL